MPLSSGEIQNPSLDRKAIKSVQKILHSISYLHLLFIPYIPHWQTERLEAMSSITGRVSTARCWAVHHRLIDFFFTAADSGQGSSLHYLFHFWTCAGPIASSTAFPWYWFYQDFVLLHLAAYPAMRHLNNQMVWPSSDSRSPQAMDGSRASAFS